MAQGSLLLGVYEWKIPQIKDVSLADDAVPELFALDPLTLAEKDVPVVEEAILSALDNSNTATQSKPSQEVAVIPPPENDQTLIEAGKSTPGLQGVGKPSQSDIAADKNKINTSSPQKTRNLPAIRPETAVMKDNQPGSKPKVFVARPAPDDPGPPVKDTEEGSTPLTRYRAPS